MMRLGELSRRLGGQLRQPQGLAAAAHGRGGLPPDREIEGVVLDSREVRPGLLFAALPGTRTAGAQFAAQALERGAAAVLCEREPLGLEAFPEAALWLHPHPRRATGQAASLLAGEPSLELFVAAVTGTNGKTSTAWWIAQLLEQVGRKPAILGTVEHRLAGGVRLPSTHTTPDAPQLQRLLARHRELGGDSVALELSSHALDQERDAGLTVDVALFTNLTRDHLDYHGSMEHYARSKERLFSGLSPSAAAVVHANDPQAPRMAEAARQRGARVYTYGLEPARASTSSTRGSEACGAGAKADLRALDLQVEPQGTQMVLEGMGIQRMALHLPLIGRHNVENALAAAAAVLLSGADAAAVVAGLGRLIPAPGRLERVACERGFEVLVDYAHTPDGLERVLHALRETLEGAASGGRLIALFGCGGNRDAGKRAPMGAIAGRLADVVVVTSDNPRDEDPRGIAQAIWSGLQGSQAECHLELERRAAIALALRLARPGDIVLIAGKGHESVQITAGLSRPFDDRLVAAEELACA